LVAARDSIKPDAHMDDIEAPSIPLAEALGPARQRAADFLRGLDPAARIVVFCHFDADGLAAGALFGRGLGC
jgi:single-stranded DNA-specific DHH superfamily exonuclease